MNGSLEDKHALVCGASSGIGRAAALRLNARGARVTALARNEDDLASLVEELGGGGYLIADLDDRMELRTTVEGFLAEHGPVHILVNNTGGPAPGPLLLASEGQLVEGFGRHVLAAHLLVQLLLPGMRETEYGRIVNVVSTSVREPIPGLGVSNTIRAAMAGWAKTLADELPSGVTVNNVLPGFTDTDRLASLGESVAARRGITVEQVREEWIGKVPEGRLGRPEEVAAAVAFLASPEGAYIRGQSLAVDGGRLRSI